MAKSFDASRFRDAPTTQGQYQRQLRRIRSEGKESECIELAVEGALASLTSSKRAAFVIYGEPQSGKTEMMIGLTARLLDEGRKFIVHLLNDSVDLLGQNLGRFQKSGMAPAAKNYTDIVDPSIQIKGRSHVVFCKKNPRDLEKLLNKIGKVKEIVVIDDEADFASPNSKVNQQEQTRINELITKLLAETGDYIGVTATPARLDLNNTFENDSALWVDFPPHRMYTGQSIFFPQRLDGQKLRYRLRPLPATHDTPTHARAAFFSFMVGVAYLNLRLGEPEQNYSMLVHTSGKREDHKRDSQIFDDAIQTLVNRDSEKFDRYAEDIWNVAVERYGSERADEITEYVLDNASRYAMFVLNSDRDFIQNGLSATNPSALFTVIVGGNIVSRGVTFENLLAMYFTRDVKHKLQQDTYIQRARMFGSRGKYLAEFELTIPAQLYVDWHRCFVFHGLALAAIKRNLGSPVWLTDNRIAAVASSSIDRSTVDVDKGEMAFHLFEFDNRYDEIAAASAPVLERLELLAQHFGGGVFPAHLRDFILQSSPDPERFVALHPASSIDGYAPGEVGLDKDRIERRKGFMGTNQLEKQKYPHAIHHLKVFYNAAGKGRLFYKFIGSIQFVKNLGR